MSETSTRSETIWNLAHAPFLVIASSSAKKEGTWTTTPDPMKPAHRSLMRPEGRRWKSNLVLTLCAREDEELREHGHSQQIAPASYRWLARWLAHLSGPMLTTMVCPALLPPAHRAQTSIFWQRISDSLPGGVQRRGVRVQADEHLVRVCRRVGASLTLSLISPLAAEDDIELCALCRLDWFWQRGHDDD